MVQTERWIFPGAWNGACTHYNPFLTPVNQKDNGSRKSAFAQHIEVKNASYEKTEKLLCSLMNYKDAISNSNSN